MGGFLPQSVVSLTSALRSWNKDNAGRRINEVGVAQRDLPIREIIRRARHDGCGGGAGKVELLTGIDGSSRPVRRIVLLDG